jgi:N-acetylneuraminic acid mutarotase
LPNGKVLVVGGSSAAGSAELYDPSTGTWSFTGSLNVPRFGHTTTLLGNGKVLVAGGWANGCCLQSDLTNTAELYDPATGEWSFTGNLNVLRTGHTATLLSNGKVLFAGNGLGGASATKTELYDPATGKWSLTGNLSETRVGHTATLLQEGKVLVAGGCGDEECFSILGSAELYDPNTETWSITGSPNTSRDTCTLTMLPSGNVLLTGGDGQSVPSTLNTAELYNPATGRWSYTGGFLNRRGGETVTLLSSGQVLVVGGYLYDSFNPPHVEVFNSAELYDPATGKWNTTASLNTARSSHTATLLSDGKVLIVGGYDGRDNLRSAELYDPGILDSAPTAPRIITASVSGKKLFITGENFHAGAVILLNGEEQRTKQPGANPQTSLIGKKAGKKIKPGDKLQVRNPDGTISEEFTFAGS